MSESKIQLLLPKDLAEQFEAELKAKHEDFLKSAPDGEFRVKRFAVSGQIVDVATIELVKIIVALGGGAGIAAMLKPLAKFIVDYQKAKRGKVKLQKGKEVVSLEGYSAEEVEKILSQIPKD